MACIKMRILIATDTYYPDVNGAAYFTYHLAALLAKRGHDVSVITPSQTSEESIYEQDGVKVYGVPSISIIIYPKFRVSPPVIAKKSIRRFVQEINPDVIHIQNHFLIGKVIVRVARELNIPIMGTNHFMPENLAHHFHLPKPAEERLKAWGWNKFLEVYKGLQLITAPTRTAADLVESLGMKKKVIPVSCGIDLKRFSPRKDGSSFRKRHNLPEDRLIMLYVGRLDREKRIEVILRALPKIIKDADVHLVIAGNGKLKAALEVMAGKLGIKDRVTFTGFVPDNELPGLYRSADLFVIAGIAELQSIVTMEAMASGLPVVAVDAMALPELVHDRENGYLFPEGDSNVLASRAIKILSNSKLRQKMSKNSLKIIKAHDIDKMIKKYESLYKKTISLAKNSKT